MIRNFLLGSFLVLTSCAYSVHDVHVSDFTPYQPLEKKGEVIQSQASQFTVMGFVSDTRYVDTARVDLEKKCSGGDISGVVTQLYTELGFFSWTNHIKMQGFCRR
jgi:hypothetical protein